MDDQELFELVRKNYCEANKEYIQQQIRQAQKEQPIGYRECADAMLMMWMDNVVTDSEYNKIMDRLNKQYSTGDQT